MIVFLSRGLLGARSGLKRSNSVVNQLVRNAVQTGLFAMTWSMVALGTYPLLPDNTVYTVFDATSGLIYTHVSDRLFRASWHIFTGGRVQMIYDGLLSRPKLRTRLSERSELEVGLPSQVRI